MRISYHQAKRDRTLSERGLDFEDAVKVFSGMVTTVRDDRRDYGEDRFLTVGWLESQIVKIVWTPRNDYRHVISMWKCNSREQRNFRRELERSR